MLRILATMAPSMAASISASSNTMKGALPPSSIAGFTTLSAASCRSLRPTSVEPVNDTTRTRGSCSIALTTVPDERDGITLTTPAGTPASSRIGISASMVRGVSEAGLSTTVQPAASAGPILRVAIAAGKFLGVPAEELGRIGDLAARIRERLAVFNRDQLGEPLGVAHDQLERLAQNLAALARLLGGPGRERGARGIDRGLRVLDRRA